MHDLTKELATLCDSYAEQNEKLIYGYPSESKKVFRYFFEFTLMKVELRYIKKESALEAPSSLYAVVYLHKNSEIYYHLIDILPYVSKKEFRQCYFTAIENKERMKIAFDELMNTVEDFFSELEALCVDDGEIKRRLFDSYKLFYSLKDKDIDFSKVENKNEEDYSFFMSLQKSRDKFLIMRFSSSPGYGDVINGRTEKAIRYYSKLDKKGMLLEYEKDLLAILRRSEENEISFGSQKANSQKLYDDFNRFSSYVKAFSVSYLVAGIFFCMVFALYDYIVSRGSLLVFGAPWYAGIIPAGLCAVGGAITFFKNMPNKRLTDKQRKEIMKIAIPKWVNVLSAVFFTGTIIFSMFSALMIMTARISMSEQEISYSSGEVFAQPKSHNYSEIEGVYYISARFNPYGDKLERPSYVVLFKDKTSVDFDGYTSIEETEEKAIPFFESKGFKVIRVDTDRDLPWYDYGNTEQ